MSVTTGAGPSPAMTTPNGSAGVTPLRPSYQEPFHINTNRDPIREVIDSKDHLRPSPDNEDNDYHRDIDHAPVNTVYHDVANRSIFSIAGVMDRKGGDDSPEYSTVSASNTKDDPVALGILTMAEVESLFGHYFDQLQTCVCLLDPAIHTARYTYRASLQLFLAVLTVASKFFRPELYDQLNNIANRLIDRAMSDCVCAIEIVQAICILHYWKKPQDGRGWLRLGHAIRLGYQLDLHLPRKDKLPNDERKARLMIDRERTWISLFCFDSTQTELVDRPSMMMRAPDVASWIREIPYPLPSDGQLDFAVKTSLLRSEVRQLQNCKGNYEILRSGLRRILEDLHRSHQTLLSDEYPVRLTSTSISINKFSTIAGQLLTECTSLSFAPKKHRISLMHACVSTSLDLLDIVVEGFVRKGIMPMIEDAHSVAVASTAVRLIRFLPYLDGSARAAVLRKMTKVVIVCREAARGDQESHPAYLARFIHALLDKAHQSRPPSRAPSPVAARQLHMTGMTPLDATMPTPQHQQQKTTPDQWWDEVVSWRVGSLRCSCQVARFADMILTGSIRLQSGAASTVQGAPGLLGRIPLACRRYEHPVSDGTTERGASWHVTRRNHRSAGSTIRVGLGFLGHCPAALEQPVARCIFDTCLHSMYLCVVQL